MAEEDKSSICERKLSKQVKSYTSKKDGYAGATYTLTIKNSGSVGATIGSVTPTKPTGTGVSCTTASGGKMVCGNITYTLATNSSGTTLLSSGSNLSSGSSLTVYLIVEYTGSSLSSSSKTQSGGKFSITYNQA